MMADFVEDLEAIKNSVLLTTFTCKKKRYKVFFHQNQIIWDKEKPPSVQVTVPIENVITVEHVNKTANHRLDDPTIDPHSFIIHYAKRRSNCTWKHATIAFSHTDPIQVASWVKTLQNTLQTFNQRPKSILLFLNPYGGKRNAMQIYEKLAKPLFQIAGVDVTVNVSQRKDQIRDFVTYHNLDMYDVVACVGGDGTVSELFNGLIIRECQLHNLDYNDINIDIPKPKMPIGIIPGGSTDTIAFCLHGTTDVQTAVLHIIFGGRIGLDLVSVYDETKLLRLYASVLSYGYLGDVAHSSDKYRWLGPKRYDYSGFKKLIYNMGYEGEIAMLSEKDDFTSSRCFESCSECSVCIDKTTEKKELVWKTIKGKYFMVSGANISCACDRSPNGIAPNSHLGDGNLHLVLVQHTSLLNNVRLLLRLSGRNKEIQQFPFVETHKAKEFCFRAINKKSKWNCDGEVQYQTDIRAKVRCQLLTILGRGMPVPTETVTNCCSFC
ncbi:PREDICTED: ceramide kinase [Nicrophorus vespilloides]|uniref:Ceramide kinase n=1 Tax=Nicrophorus vespilloides TaxID=110193 RepID=A0ABM1MA67_NICVS|nr:PREDICTED: ceramide kinase [Nicrophorus vespilloides]